MKLKLPAPVTIKGPNGESIQVSAAQIIEHVVRTGRDLGRSSDIANVRTGARILAAMASGSDTQSEDIAPADVDALKVALKKPTRGWASIEVEVDLAASPGAPARTVRQHLSPSPLDLLPLIDGLLSS